jgi:hypothetical protein
MTDTETQLTAVYEFLRETGNDALATRLKLLDGRLAPRREVRETIADVRRLIDRSRGVGLADDPAVEELQKQARTIAHRYGLNGIEAAGSPRQRRV